MRRLFVALFLGGLLAAGESVLPFAPGGRCWGRQTPSPEPDHSGNKSVPTLTFDLAFPGSDPSHYSIVVESTGGTIYRSDQGDVQGERAVTAAEPYRVEFTMSETTRSRIFQLAKEANYFQGDFNYTKTRVADTGTKTLTFSEGPADPSGSPTSAKRTQSVYNYSQNPAIQQLTTIFQQISATLELGHRIAYLRRFDKLGLDAALKRADEMAAEQQLLEVQAIAPTLRSIVDDYRVLHIAREHAQHLVELAGR